MAGIGKAMIEFTDLIDQHIGDAIADEHAADRQIAR
jgi:hypothetical protein